MKKFKLKHLGLIVGLNLVSVAAIAGLKTDRAVVRTDGSDRISATVTFAEPVSGDLYVATAVNGVLFMFADEGRKFSTDLEPFRANDSFSDDIVVLDFSGQGVAPGIYPLYQVVTRPGSNPADTNNWIGGPQGLSVINFSIGLTPDISGDHDGDGFADDDGDRDGFHDDDSNKDGVIDGQDNAGDAVAGQSKFESIGCSNSTCHGADPGTNQNQILEGKDPSEIRQAIGRVPEMAFLSDISDVDLRDVAAYLRTFNEVNNTVSGDPAAGQSKFESNGCSNSTCHGADPGMNQNHVLEGKDPGHIREAINDVLEMAFLTELSDQDIQDLAAYLGTF